MWSARGLFFEYQDFFRRYVFCSLPSLAIGWTFLTDAFTGNSTLAGALAALTANVVLVAYVVVAWQEDKEDQEKKKEKKGQ
jgi:hypothetical protein